MSEHNEALEERIAHLERAVDDLSEIVAKQRDALDLATRRIAMLMQREATRDADGGGGVYVADDKPPHW